MAYAIGTNKTTVNITLMSPAIPMTQAFTAISKGYDTGAVSKNQKLQKFFFE